MVQVGVAAEKEVSFEKFENDGGSCPECRRSVELRTCSECGTSAWVIECAHRSHPVWLRRGRSDGTARSRIFCGDCADVLPPKPLPA
jgi:hypothetical protein